MNRLADQSSPYLLQHADNPVDWYPWGDEALTRAKTEDKPILLSVGYSACHWCHVMAHESFENPQIAKQMNSDFVCIKVDREERPDVDDLYMEAVQAMTGGGGWPLTAFLDPEGVPFHGGTYFPPEPRQGMPSFPQVMDAVIDAYRNRRDEIDDASEKVREGLGAVGRLEASGEALEPDDLGRAAEGMRVDSDAENGGFGGAPKFPNSSALEFLMMRGPMTQKQEGDTGPMTHVQLTLDKMAAGGIYDHVGGGFARYAVDANWLVPHFEKMLYDNAQLARTYLHGFQILGHGRYERTCRETLDFMLRELRGPEGGFYSALDADSEGEEGKFYVWEEDQIREALAQTDLADASIERILGYWGVSPSGNFEGKNVLHVVAGPGTRPPPGLEEAREALLAKRAERVRPGLDDKRVCSWNALAIAAFAEAGAVLGADEYLDAARTCAAFIDEQMRDGQGHLLRTGGPGRAAEEPPVMPKGPPILAYLEDHAFLLEGLLTLYEATFEERWFTLARETADTMIERFGDDERGGFFVTASDSEQLIARRKDLGDHPIPSGNSSAAFGLLRLAQLTGEHSYAEQAERVFAVFGPVSLQQPVGFGHLLCALDFNFAKTREAALVGDDLAELGAVVWGRYLPHLVRAGGPEGTAEPALMRDRTTLDGKPAAYVCENFACKQPVSEAAELEALLA